MPFYYFFKQTTPPEPSGWTWLETCENHEEAAAKERAYETLTRDGGPVVRRVHASSQDDAQEIIDTYGPK